MKKATLKVESESFIEITFSSCEQFPTFTEEKSYRKQQQQQQQKQQQHCNKETVDTWDSSDDSDADLSQLIPAIHTHHQKVSQGVIKKQQQQESSLNNHYHQESI